MADIAAADVTYAKQGTKEWKDNHGYYHGVFSVAFGNGSLTYPSGGVPLTKAKLGCPNEVVELHLMEQKASDGLTYKLDYVNLKLRIYNTSNVELTGGSTAVTAATMYVKVVGW